MKNVLLICCLIISACNLFPKSPEQKKIEISVNHYLDSINKPSKYEIISFKAMHAIYSTYEDDPLYDKYKNDPLKADSIKKNYKSIIRGWVIYVTYNGKDGYGNPGKHTCQCWVTKDFKMLTGIEVGDVNVR